MADRPYTLLSCSMSLDGYLDSSTVQRLALSNDADFDRVDALRAGCDAILVGASGTAAALPQTALRERGYTGLIYQTHGAASMDFIRIAGKAAEGVLMASGPVMDPEDQPDSALTKKPGLALDKAYEAKYGANSRSQFAGHSYDAFLVLERIIPVALKTAKPGTPEFREAIRQALLSEHEIAASQGVYNFTEKDRYGLDDRSRIILTVKDGKYAPAM
jgi:branched-chain amino acid transport system substrate-binding protein